MWSAFTISRPLSHAFAYFALHSVAKGLFGVGLVPLLLKDPSEWSPVMVTHSEWQCLAQVVAINRECTMLRPEAMESL